VKPHQSCTYPLPTPPPQAGEGDTPQFAGAPRSTNRCQRNALRLLRPTRSFSPRSANARKFAARDSISRETCTLRTRRVRLAPAGAVIAMEGMSSLSPQYPGLQAIPGMGTKSSRFPPACRLAVLALPHEGSRWRDRVGPKSRPLRPPAAVVLAGHRRSRTEPSPARCFAENIASIVTGARRASLGAIDQGPNNRFGDPCDNLTTANTPTP